MPLQLIDDTDSSIQYHPKEQWTPQSGDRSFKDQTYHSINNVQNASIEYTFQGTSIQVYGMVQPNPPQQCNNETMLYTLDGILQQFQLLPVPGEHNQLLFQPPEPLEHENHTLQITVNSADCRCMFDYFAVQTSEPVTSSSQGVPTASESATTSSTSAAPSSAPKHEANVGGVVGGVIAATVSVILVALALLFFRRKRRRLHEANARQTVTPFGDPPKSHSNEPPTLAPQAPPATPAPAASLPLAEEARPQSQSTYSVSAPPSYSKLYPE